MRLAAQRGVLAGAALVLAVMTSGCWDAVDVDKRGFVGMIGIESVGDPSEPMVAVTVRIPTFPGREQPSGQSGGAGSGTSPSGAPRPEVATGIGMYAEEAMATLRSRGGGILDLSALEYLVIGSTVLPCDLARALSAIMFSPYVPLTPLVFTTHENPASLFRVQLSGGRDLADHISGMQAQSELGLGSIQFRQIWEIAAILRNKTGDITLPIIDMIGSGERNVYELYFAGVAAYDGTKRVGIVDPEDAILLDSVSSGGSKGGVIRVRDGDRDIVVRLSGVTPRVKAARRHGQPAIAIDVRASGRLMDSGALRLGLMDRDDLKRLAGVVEKHMEKRLRSILSYLQGLNSDAMRLYHHVRPNMPEMSFDEFKQVYPSLDVEFRVSVDLTRAGLMR
ncbi:MAG: Ger(x)C family spore germination C-terminal domain-containing protein [Clostridia bacterium]|nr:Ger(x)C family spore germination C-terminal domain-containing protein [Clostridia bacterium]